MDLKRKLAALPPLSRAPAAGVSAPASELRTKTTLGDTSRSTPSNDTSCRTALHGTSCGVEVIDHVLDAGARYGGRYLTDLLRFDPQLLGAMALDEDAQQVSLEDVLFLDTETTGLAAGVATIPFLIGLGFFRDGAFCVRQLVLHDLSEEPLMLELLREAVSRASCIATYNGKSYDWPRIEARCILCRVRSPEARPHVDLFHMARRIYGGRLESLRLVDIEREVLGVFRDHDHDIDGADIPSAYWSYLRGRDRSLLAPILEHNVQDLLALPAMLGQMLDAFSTPWRARPSEEQFGLARLAARAKDEDRCLAFLDVLMTMPVDSGGKVAAEAVAEGALLGARILTRRRAFSTASSLLQGALVHLEGEEEFSGKLHLALAKLYEHKLYDWPSACDHADRSALLRAEATDSSDRRRHRLDLKRQRAGGTSTEAPR